MKWEKAHGEGREERGTPSNTFEQKTGVLVTLTGNRWATARYTRGVVAVGAESPVARSLHMQIAGLVNLMIKCQREAVECTACQLFDNLSDSNTEERARTCSRLDSRCLRM